MNHKIENGTLTLSMQEDLLSSNVEVLRVACKEAIETASEVQNLFIDLSAIKVVDSKGLNLLIGLYQEANRRTWKFKVNGASSEIRQLFSFVKLAERFGV